MTGLQPDVATPGYEHEDVDLLNQVRDAVVVLLAGLPGAPERLRVRAWDVVVELSWAAQEPPGSVPVEDTADGDRTPTDITASNVGTFHRCPAPGSDPFVRVGDRVAPGQQVAVVEAMRLMLPVEADAGGVITDVLVDEGQPVEYGQALFTLQREIR